MTASRDAPPRAVLARRGCPSCRGERVPTGAYADRDVELPGRLAPGGEYLSASFHPFRRRKCRDVSGTQLRGLLVPSPHGAHLVLQERGPGRFLVRLAGCRAARPLGSAPRGQVRSGQVEFPSVQRLQGRKGRTLPAVPAPSREVRLSAGCREGGGGPCQHPAWFSAKF